MSFISVLDNIGTIFKDIFTEVLPIAKDAEPIIGTLFPAFGPLYNEAVTLISMAEATAAAANAKKAGKAKMALVVAGLHPLAVANQAQLGITAPTYAQTEAYAQSVVDGLKAYAAVNPKKI
jgi:hypothetical protein